jgi:hypothetical protein
MKKVALTSIFFMISSLSAFAADTAADINNTLLHNVVDQVAPASKNTNVDGNVPPGLRDKNSYSNEHQTPPGWSHGEKRGWDKNRSHGYKHGKHNYRDSNGNRYNHENDNGHGNGHGHGRGK